MLKEGADYEFPARREESAKPLEGFGAVGKPLPTEAGRDEIKGRMSRFCPIGLRMFAIHKTIGNTLIVP
ncbi:hypothetical protein AA15669_1047 [Saccharibacter floricola DSM 15669]|uniref:Uncharacterized protein n=1 Tax=Saccharibacter floricola DSM 15669 TaxID=1123227 RepID=A0ABQ0NYK7_9PROT|nr:hypothetical protein AA15669_1047 [Saccharibacter floricola DSM 15669]